MRFKLMKKNAQRFLLGCFLFPFFVGCSSYSSQFDCPAGSGVRCQSVSEVNSMVDKGKFPAKKKKKIKKKPSLLKRLFGKKKTTPFVTQDKRINPNVNTLERVYRIPEKTVRILVGAYESESGDHLEERFIYTVVEKGKWGTIDLPEIEEVSHVQ